MVLWSPAGMTWKEHSSLVFIGRPGQLHERSSYPCVLTNCLGLIRYMWPAGTASCLCRMTDMICSSALVPPPPPLPPSGVVVYIFNPSTWEAVAGKSQ